MPLDYNVVEEFHVRFEVDGKALPGKMWLRDGEEWEIEIREGEPRLAAPADGDRGMTPLALFGRVRAVLAERGVQPRVCGGCAHFRRAPDEGGEGWIGHCAYRGASPDAPPLPGQVALLAPDCHVWSPVAGVPPMADLAEIAAGARPDAEETRTLPAVSRDENGGLLGRIGRLFGMQREEPEFVRAGVVERPGGQPCPVCGTRMTNRASVANADERGEERVLSVWRCPHCAGNYLDDWFEAYVGSRAHDAERLYVVPPVEANAAAEIVVHCPRPDIKGCTCIANQHFDRWGNDLAENGRRIAARESVVSL